MLTTKADTKYSVSPVAKIAVIPKDGKDMQKIDLPRKKRICICVNKMDCDTADNKQENFDEISNEMESVSNKMTSWTEHPQPAEMLERMLRMSENGDD